MQNVGLNETQLRNLLVFLNRVQLTGQEAEELVAIKAHIIEALTPVVDVPVLETEAEDE